jgi:hypothetical protein
MTVNTYIQAGSGPHDSQRYRRESHYRAGLYVHAARYQHERNEYRDDAYRGKVVETAEKHVGAQKTRVYRAEYDDFQQDKGCKERFPPRQPPQTGQVGRTITRYGHRFLRLA